MTDTAHLLTSISDSLANGTTPIDVINSLLHKNMPEAKTWARRLPLYDELRDQFGKQTVGIARVVSTRAMRQFDLAFDHEGRLVEKMSQKPPGPKEPPGITFPLTIAGEEIQVKYQKCYYPGQDYFSFIGENLPQEQWDVIRKHKPHALLSTGWLSHAASHYAVDAVGGPEAYARLYADAVLGEHDHTFEAAFNGPRQDAKPKKQTEPKMVIGAVIEKAQESG